MEEKKEKKINLKVANFITIAVLLLVFGILFLVYYLDNKPERSITSVEGLTSTTTTYRNTNKKVSMESNVEYEIIEDSINLGYYIYGSNSGYSVYVKADNLFVKSKEELLNNLSECIMVYSGESEYTYNGARRVDVESEKIDYLTSEIYLEHQEILAQFDDNFFEKNNLIVILMDSEAGGARNISSIVVEDGKGTVNSLYRYSLDGNRIAILPVPQVVFVSVDKSIDEVEFDVYYEEESDNFGLIIMLISSGIISIVVIILVTMIVSKYNKRKENKSRTRRILENMNFIIFTLVFIGIIIFSAIVFAEAMFGEDVYATEDKPIIYLYPTEETNVNVKLGYEENITVSYPKYVDGWNVIAKEDGTLVDTKTNRNLYALYYESIDKTGYKIEEEGFVVKGEDTIEFLEEKLAILGLNERESEEFIVYWLPKLEANKYNYIRFATDEEIEENMPLIIEPKPDTVIRVLMTFKELKKPIEVKEQELTTPERNGFVTVEWGGTEIK